MELSPSEPVGFTYQVYDIAQLEPQAAYSNSFEIPDTNSNRIALGFADTIGTNTNIPYRKPASTYIRNGIQIINNGVTILEEYTGVSFRITIYSSIFDFFQQLGDQDMKAIDWSSLNHTYDLPSIRDVNQRWFGGSPQSNVCWPLINWGGYSRTGPVDIRYLMPSIKYSYIFQKIFALTDYTYSGNIFQESIFDQKTLTLSPDVFTVDAATLRARSIKTSLFQTNYSIANYHRRILVNLLALYKTVNEYDDYDSTEGAFNKDIINPEKTTGFYSPPYSDININGRPSFIDGRGNVVHAVPPLNKSSYQSSWFETVLITAHFWYKTKNSQDVDTGISSPAKYVILKNDEIIVKTTLDAGVIQLFENEYSIDLIPGDELKVYIEGQDFQTYKERLGEHSYVNIEAQNSLLINEVLNYNALVPALKLKDIVRCFCQEFALIVRPDDTLKNISFTGFKEIKQNIGKAENWTSKLVDAKPSISYRIGNYAQKNNLKWLTDDLTKGYGDGFFTIDNNVLQTTVDIFEMIYPSALPYNNIRATSDQPASGNTGVEIPRYTLVEADQWAGYIEYSEGDQVNYGGIIYIALQDNQNFTPNDHPARWEPIELQFVQTESSANRLLLIRKLGTSPFDQVQFTDGVNTLESRTSEIPLAYFTDTQQINQLNFSWLIPKYYREFIDMLTHLKVVSALFNLNELDILQLDFLLLKYIENFGNHFYLTTVEEYISGQSTRCQLIRM